MRKTKIVCTIGPASSEMEVMKELLHEGMDIARLNFSHGSFADHLQQLKRLRQAADEMGKNLGVMLDIQGPKIRTGELKEDPVMLQPCQAVTLTTEPCLGTSERVFVSYKKLAQGLKPGMTVFIDDGLLELEVKKVQGNDVFCQVINGGYLHSRKGVTLPGVDIDLPALTETDANHIRFGVEHGVDFIAASFVRTPENIMDVRRVINDAGADIPIIAKIESDAGLRNLDRIIAVADGVMVARGDLGVEIRTEELALAQKAIIRKCNDAGIPVITATQMLDSMIRNPRPTRAEVTDVANAILDGTDCVMLSGETAIGRYPEQAVGVMSRISQKMEESIDYHELLNRKRGRSGRTIEDAISLATCETAQSLQVKAILCSTQAGTTARSISRYRPQSPIIAVCSSEKVRRQLALVWGVQPICLPQPENIEQMIDMAVAAAKERHIVQGGDTVTITAGVRTGIHGSTNLLQVYRVER